MSVIQNNSDSRSKLEQEIKRLETVDMSTPKSASLPEVTLDELSYTPPSDEYIKQTAESSLDEYRKSGEQSIRDESARNEKTLISEREAYAAGRERDQKALDESYEKSRQAVNNDAVKRGLARSSVASVAQAELEKEYLGRNAELAASYGKKISELDAELSSLEGKLQAALNDFNLSYATKLNAKISELTDERDKKVEAVTKFNNDVRKNQAKLDEDRARADEYLQTSALSRKKAASELDKIPSDERDKIYGAVYDEMDKFLSSLSPEQAELEIKNHSLYRQHLSDYYYYKLYAKYGRPYEN